MKKSIVDLVFILDASGSMSSLTDSTIKGFNEMLERQKAALSEEEVLVTIVTFNTENTYLTFCEKLDKVEPLSRETYYTDGFTALNDAVGETINRISTNQTEHKKKGTKRKSIVIITTDGYENSSKEYTRTRVRALIKSKEKLGWKFVFMGADINAEEEGGSLGISRADCYRVDHSDAGIYGQMRIACEQIFEFRDLEPKDDRAENALLDFLDTQKPPKA